MRTPIIEPKKSFFERLKEKYERRSPQERQAIIAAAVLIALTAIGWGLAKTPNSGKKTDERNLSITNGSGAVVVGDRNKVIVDNSINPANVRELSNIVKSAIGESMHQLDTNAALVEVLGRELKQLRSEGEVRKKELEQKEDQISRALAKIEQLESELKKSISISKLSTEDQERIKKIIAAAQAGIAIVGTNRPAINSGQAQVVSTASSPPVAGVSIGGGMVPAGSAVTVTAVAKPGYQFVLWTENGAVVSLSPTYTFTANGPRTLVAQFAKISAQD